MLILFSTSTVSLHRADRTVPEPRAARGSGREGPLEPRPRLPSQPGRQPRHILPAQADPMAPAGAQREGQRLSAGARGGLPHKGAPGPAGTSGAHAQRCQ